MNKKGGYKVDIKEIEESREFFIQYLLFKGLSREDAEKFIKDNHIGGEDEKRFQEYKK